jgi:hypothetical protein
VVERGPEKAGVGGSIPSLATTTSFQVVSAHSRKSHNRLIFNVICSIVYRPVS